MAAAVFTNNATTTLSSSILATDTSIAVAAATGALFPALSGGNYFYATLIDASNNIEIVKVTARASDTMTVVRAQEGTTARAYASGSRFELRVTAAALNAMFTSAGGTVSTLTVTGAFTIPTTVTLTGTTAFTGGTSNFSALQVGGVSVATLTGTQTLTNKTLTAPIISTISNTGTITLPTSSDTLVGRATTDTLTNKTITGLASGSTLKDAGGTAWSMGYLGAPLNTVSTSTYTFVLADAGKCVVNSTGDFAIPANATTAFPTDTVITFFNNSASSRSLTITTDTLRLNGTTSTGTRTVPPYGLCGIKKIASTTWVAWGVT